MRTVHRGDKHLHKFIRSVSTVPFFTFPIINSWKNVKILVEKQLMFTANCSCSVLREKQHSWQNNLPLGPDLNPRKARRTIPCFLAQAILILSISWISYTLVKIGWTCGPRHRKKKKNIFRSTYFIWTKKKIFEIGCWMLYCKEAERRKLGTITSTKKRWGFFPFKSLLFVYFIYSKFFSLNFKASEYH